MDESALIAPPPAAEADDWCVSNGIAWIKLLKLVRAVIAAHERCHSKRIEAFRREYDAVKAVPPE
ncbi:MAG: hypothetical protein QM758_13625 [Armatimonas sp.]